jgi:DNA-binding transcriptional MerR regulator
MTELPLDSRDARRWVPVAEAAAVAGVSASALRRWQHSGRIAHRLETGRGRRLVDLDEVLGLRAVGVGADNRSSSERDNVVSLEANAAAAEFRERLERATEAAAEAEERAAAAEADAEELRRRMRELESWIADSTRFEEVEQLQLGRLLALASAEREARRLPLIASARTLLLALYLLVVVAFIVLLLTRL